MRATTLGLLAATLTIAGCATSAQVRPSRAALADCANLQSEAALASVYTPGSVTHVAPKYRQETLGRGAILPRYVAGADLYVAAQPGITRSYLERALVCHAASNVERHANDPLQTPGDIAVSVQEAGPAMRISIVGESRSTGSAIFERAQTLQGGSVAVEQLSAAPARAHL